MLDCWDTRRILVSSFFGHPNSSEICRIFRSSSEAVQGVREIFGGTYTQTDPNFPEYSGETPERTLAEHPDSGTPLLPDEPRGVLLLDLKNLVWDQFQVY